MSPSPYHDAFDEVLDIRKCDFSKHLTAGLSLLEHNGRLILAHMAPSTPGAKVPRWRTRLRGAWLIKIDDKSVNTIEDARKVFATLSEKGAPSAHLLFAHPEVRPDILRRGLPIISSEPFSLLTHAQLNDRWEFSTVTSHLSKTPTYDLIESGEVLNVVTRVMRLTRGKLLKQHDWEEWQTSEFLQLDQHDAQGMFGSPVLVDSNAAVFHLVWTYAIKAVDGRKKAKWACDGSSRSGAKILDETYQLCRPDKLAFILCNRCGRKHVDFWSRCIQCICRGTTTKTGILYTPRPSFS
jgi:hypothetical protein